MGAMASQISSLMTLYSTVYSGTDQRQHQSSASLAFVWGIHRWLLNSPHKWQVTRKMFPFDDIIMINHVIIPGMYCNTALYSVGYLLLSQQWILISFQSTSWWSIAQWWIEPGWLTVSYTCCRTAAGAVIHRNSKTVKEMAKRTSWFNASCVEFK